MYVRDELERKYGKAFVEQGGLEVITTLDLRIQKLAEQVVQDEIDKLADLNVTNGAVVVLSPTTGEVLAMVGSKDYFDLEADGNVNVTISLRQPGSSIKVVNYAYVLSNGYTPATVIVDSPITFLVQGQEPYTPRNYEGGFRGALTIRSAFAESRNVPAVKILNSYGVREMIEQGRKMGITTWTNPDNYGLSLTLGGGEVRLIDLARVYATVANYGKIPNIKSVIKITNYNGAVIEEEKCEEIEDIPLIASVNASESAQLIKTPPLTNCAGEQVLDPRVAFLITDILRDNAARSPSFGTNSMLVIPNHAEVAVKTGTSNNLRDNLTVGYNQNYLVAVWVGNNDNSPMSRIASGVTGASPIFNNIMSALLAQKENHDWGIPEGMIQLPICPLTGTLACTGCPVKMEWFLEENKPEVACHPDWFKKVEEEDKSEEGKKPFYEYIVQPSPKIKRGRFPIF
jgi:membrane carboxypeptidase/penicillin-binding protein